MKILITSGAGFIGSNLTKKLFRDNNEIFIVDNLWRGKLENLNFNDNNFHIKKNFKKLDLKFIKRESLWEKNVLYVSKTN